MTFTTKRRVPVKVMEKARALLAGGAQARGVWFDPKIRIIDVGPRWRLLSRGKGWVLLSHEDYNNEVAKR